MTQYQTQNWKAKIEDLTCFGSAIRTEKKTRHCYFNKLLLILVCKTHYSVLYYKQQRDVGPLCCVLHGQACN